MRYAVGMSLNELAAPFGISGDTLLLILIWTLVWKAASLWVAARSNNKWWFIALLLMNTVGILDAIYLFLVKKGKWPKEVVIDRIEK